jgi:threonine dehydrogenase-like Zn-dependent dehydrogenase
VQAGATVVATAGERNHELLRGFGAVPVTFGPGLIERVREVAPNGVEAAIDTVGTDEAIDTSLELVADKSRIVSMAAFGRADSGITIVSADDPKTRVRANAWRTLLPAAAGRQPQDQHHQDVPAHRGRRGMAVRAGRASGRQGRAAAVARRPEHRGDRP